MSLNIKIRNIQQISEPNKYQNMYAQPHQKQQRDQQDFMIEQQINLFSAALPQIRRGQSDIFFKEIYRDQGYTIASVQLGFQVAKISPQMYDFVCVFINEIHCQSQQNLKLIIDGDQLWATSTIIYPIHLLSEPNYNMIESNYRESLMKTREILRQLLKQCRTRYDSNQVDQQILKDIKSKFKLISKAFKDPNCDY